MTVWTCREQDAAAEDRERALKSSGAKSNWRMLELHKTYFFLVVCAQYDQISFVRK